MNQIITEAKSIKIGIESQLIQDTSPRRDQGLGDADQKIASDNLKRNNLLPPI